MSAGKFVMYAFLVILAVVLVRNAAGSVGIILAGGTESAALVKAFEGGKTSNSKGTFKAGSTSIALG